jgi:hypothetical protein
MALVFEDASKPVAQRENEFRDVVKYLADNKDSVKSYTVTAETLEAAYAQAESDKRKMAEAGNELSEKRTIRTREEELNDGKSLKVYLWAAPKIRRKPRTEEEKAAAAVKRAATLAAKKAAKPAVKPAAKPAAK